MDKPVMRVVVLGVVGHECDGFRDGSAGNQQIEISNRLTLLP